MVFWKPRPRSGDVWGKLHMLEWMARFGSSKGVGIIMFSFDGNRLGCRSKVLGIGSSGSESEPSLGHFTSYPHLLFVINYIVFYRMH